MIKLGTFVRFCAVLALTAAASSLAFAQNDKTWVSGNGTDSGSCVRTAPCRTFAFAAAITNAFGEIDVVDGGSFGPVTLTKAVTIDGKGGVAAIQVNNASAITINLANATDVVHLKGLQINGMHPFMVPSPAANAINFVGVGNLIVEGSNIENFHGSAINFQSTSGGSVVVKDSTINNNDGSAIYVAAGTGTPTVSVNNVHLNNNGFGLNIGSSAQGSIRNSEINSAFYVAILVAPASGSATLTAETVLIHNGNQGIYSGFAAGTANVRISDVTIVDNTGSGMTYTGGSNITSFGNNRLNGNGAGNGTASIVLSQQ